MTNPKMLKVSYSIKTDIMSQQLIPHINHALVPKPHTPMYLMHKFWARKPDNVVSEYISHYSRKNEIILDPFCGSGVTPIEALKLHRKAIATDIDPISNFITRMSIIPINLDDFKNAFESIETNVKPKLDNLYSTKCPKCGGQAQIICTYWHNDTVGQIRNLLCPKDGVVRGKDLDTSDLELLQTISKQEIPHWYPKGNLQYPNGRDFKEGTHIKGLESISSLFTKRNLIANSILYNEIESLSNKIVRDLMKFAFSSMLAQTTKMMLWSDSSRPSWKVHRYWVPPNNVELNVWDRFENRYFDVLHGKEDAQKIIGYVTEGQSFADLSGKDFVIGFQSALNLLDKPTLMPSDSIDYVFTDPPYGGSVQYMELSAMWCAWLSGKNNDSRFQMNYDEEVTINDAQGKDFDFYHKMLRASFEEIYRVLKPSHWLTVTFHNTEIRIYNSIIKAIVLSGFDLEKIVYQPPAKKGAKQQLQPYGSAIGDYYIRFRKPAKRMGLHNESEIAKERYERIIVDAVKGMIAKRGEPTPYSLIINSYAYIYDDLKKNGYYLTEPEGIDKILKKQLKSNTEFVIHEGKWWFKDPSSVPFIERVPLNERVEISVMNVLYRKIKVSYDEILQEIFIKFPNSLTPETQSVMDVLKDNAKKTPDGNWMLDPNVKKRFNEHDNIVEKIALIGQKLGYEVHADLQGWRKDSFPQITADNSRHVKEIDVVWYTPKVITHEFEVENTTGLWSAIVRGSSITSPNVKRFMVIPEERQKSFNERLNLPVLQEKIKQEKWRYILYDTLKIYYDSFKRKRTPFETDFEEISKNPELAKKIVESLDHFTKEA